MSFPVRTQGAGASKPFRIDVAHISVWSATKIAFLLGILCGVVTFLVLIVAWSALSATGVFHQLTHLFVSDLQSPGSSLITGLFSFKTAFEVSLILGVLAIISVTLFGLVASALYNLFVNITGGAVVGFEQANRS